MKKKLVFVKVVYWVGIIGDLITCVPLLFPEVAKKMYGLAEINVTGEYQYVARIAAALMFGWTCMLFWAVFRPVERRGALLVTLFPVMCGLVTASVLAVTSGLVPLSNMVSVFVFNGIIVVVFILAYFHAVELARNPVSQTS